MAKKAVSYLNSVVSTPGAKFMTLDLKDFYLNTPMEWPEFLRMKIDHFHRISSTTIHSLKDMVDDKGYLLVHVEKGMCGLPQAGIIKLQLLEKKAGGGRLSPERHHTRILDT